MSLNAARGRWIPVVARDGARQVMSTADVLREAGRIGELDLPDPTEHTAVLGLLVALVYQACGAPVDVTARPDLHHTADWVQTNTDRFGVFDTGRPLGQNPALSQIADEPGPGCRCMCCAGMRRGCGPR